MPSVFSGIKILDVTKAFSGPFATRMFADYGAEVLKIEHAAYYDDARDYPPLKNSWSGYYEILNRNKKGLSLNLKNPEDRQKFYQLAKEADVIVENLTPKTKTVLGIDYKTIKKINQSIIYASLSGKGQHTNEKYYDVLAQAESGLLSLSGTPEIPMKIGPSVVDAFSGMTLAFGIASALFQRERTGTGQMIEVSMLGSAMQLLESSLTEYSVTGKNPIRTGNTDNAIAPFGIFRTKDNRIALAIGNNMQWELFTRCFRENPFLASEKFTTNELRLTNKHVLTEVIERSFTALTSEILLKKLTEAGIPCAPVNHMQDVVNNATFYTNGYIQKLRHPILGDIVVPAAPLTFSESPDIPFDNAPAIGEHNSEYGV